MKASAIDRPIVVILCCVSLWNTASLANASEEKASNTIMLWPKDAAGQGTEGMGTPKPDRGDGHIRLTGVIVNLGGDNVTINTDLSDPNQRIRVDRKQVKSIELSKVSPMPPMLLMMLKENEILDLVAYVLSGGDKSNEMFKK